MKQTNRRFTKTYLSKVICKEKMFGGNFRFIGIVNRPLVKVNGNSERSDFAAIFIKNTLLFPAQFSYVVLLALLLLKAKRHSCVCCNQRKAFDNFRR